MLGRILDYGVFHTISAIVALTRIGSYDLILAPSPPLTIGLSAWLLSLMRRVPFIYNVQEIYPDVAVSLGVLRSRLAIRAMESLERFVYNRAPVIAVISDFFRQRLLAKEIPDEKIKVIPNFVDTEFMKPGAPRNSFAKSHGLEDKFVVLYAGNIGLTQNFENLLSAARRLTRIPDISLLIVGEGTRRPWLEAQLHSIEYPNVMLLPYQPRSVVPQIYACSDVSLVPLKCGTAKNTFPSKIYTIMAAGRPVIVAADKDSELNWLVKETGCGWAVPPDNDEELARAIEHAYEQRSCLVQKGKLGRKYVMENHSRQAVARQYDKIIRKVIDAN